MRHCDEETLAALALGEPVDAADSAHVASCARCAESVAELRALTATLVDAGRTGPLVAPPASVWDSIEAEVTAEDAAGPGRVTRLEERPRRERGRLVRPWAVGAAAAAGVLVGAAGVGVILSGGDPGPEQVLVAQADLADLATEEPAGTARVEQRADGTEVLVVDTTYAPSADGALEVWMIDSEVAGMVSLGFLTGDHGEFEIPAGYDATGFPIVDISIEPADGDPTHSGASITRGVLES